MNASGSTLLAPGQSLFVPFSQPASKFVLGYAEFATGYLAKSEQIIILGQPNFFKRRDVLASHHTNEVVGGAAVFFRVELLKNLLYGYHRFEGAVVGVVHGTHARFIGTTAAVRPSTTAVMCSAQRFNAADFSRS